MRIYCTTGMVPESVYLKKMSGKYPLFMVKISTYSVKVIRGPQFPHPANVNLDICAFSFGIVITS